MEFIDQHFSRWLHIGNAGNAGARFVEDLRVNGNAQPARQGGEMDDGIRGTAQGDAKTYGIGEGARG